MRQSSWLALALLAPLCFGQGPVRAPQPLYAGCSPNEDKLAAIGPDDRVEVNYALSGGTGTCYKVTLRRGAEATTGYVLGEDLPAVAAFERQQEKSRAEAAEAERIEQQRALEQSRRDEIARSLAAAQAAKVKPPVGSSNPNTPAQFEDFSGRDLKGKSVSLSGLGGKVTLVTFWSPRSAASKGQLTGITSLYNKYKGAGLRVIGVSTDPNLAHMNEALDDITLPFPQIGDRAGLASRYGANAATGTTFVLDASHHIVAAGLSQAELGNKVRELMAAK